MSKSFERFRQMPAGATERILWARSEVVSAGVAGGKRFRQISLSIPRESPVLNFGSDDLAEVGDQYRMIRTRLARAEASLQMMLVTSANPGDGKTVNAINLAGALAMRKSSRVLLVDADLRRPAVSLNLGLSEEVGLADVLHRTSRPEEAILQCTQLPNLHILCAGSERSEPADLLDSDTWVETCAYFRDNFDFIVFDVPPFGATAEYELIQKAVDGVILIVRQDHTKRALLTKAVAEIPKGKLIGVILNCVQDWFLWKSPASYYGYYTRK